MKEEPALLLAFSGQKPGDVAEGQDRQPERAAELDEARTLSGRVDVEATGVVRRLAGDDPHRPSADAGEADDEAPRVVTAQLRKRALVHERPHELLHVVALALVGRDDVGDLRRRPIDRIAGLGGGWIVRCGRGQIRQHPSRVVEARLFVGRPELHQPGRGRVHGHAADLLDGRVLAGHDLGDLAPGDEEKPGLVVADDHVHQRGAVSGTAHAEPEDHADLRHPPREVRGAAEDLGEAREGLGALVDPHAVGVVDRDDGQTLTSRHVHEPDDLARPPDAQRAAQHRRVVGVDRDPPSVDAPEAADDTIAEGAVLPRAAPRDLGELAHLREAPVVEEHVDALPGEEPAETMLTALQLLPAAALGLRLELGQARQIGVLLLVAHAQPPVLLATKSTSIPTFWIS